MVQINYFNSLNICHLHFISRNQLISWKYFISSYNFLSMNEAIRERVGVAPIVEKIIENKIIN